MNRKKNWMYISLGAIALSLLSLLLPIISYRSAETGVLTNYNAISMFKNSELIITVFHEYNGDFLYDMTFRELSTAIIILSLIGIAAIIMAFIGIRSMAKQYESAWPFRLAIGGLIGTALPSITLLILFLLSQNQFAGKMSLGVYIIVTPVAMILACCTVVNRHRLTQEEAYLQKEARAYIYPAGDLPCQ